MKSRLLVSDRPLPRGFNWPNPDVPIGDIDGDCSDSDRDDDIDDSSDSDNIVTMVMRTSVDDSARGSWHG